MQVADQPADDEPLTPPASPAEGRYHPLPQAGEWAPVRVFPVPNYATDYSGPRTDFRETVYWAPSLKTGEGGEARVQFPLSDGVTTFRATVEGLSAGGLPGHAESKIVSKLPVSLAAKLPLELSVGDVVQLPVSITNATSRPQNARVQANFGSALQRTNGDSSTPIALGPGETRTVVFGLQVKPDIRAPGAGDIAVSG